MLPQIEQGSHCYNFYHSGYIVVAEDYPGGGPEGWARLSKAATATIPHTGKAILGGGKGAPGRCARFGKAATATTPAHWLITSRRGGAQKVSRELPMWVAKGLAF